MSRSENVKTGTWTCAPAAWLVVGAFIVGLGGCQGAYFLTTKETEDIRAEYGKIGDRLVAILVWADQSTMDIYPRCRKQVADAIGYYMKKHLPNVRLVDSRTIETFQQDHAATWDSMCRADQCEELDAEMLMRVDLLEFTTRAAHTRELRKGRVRATLNLFECGEAASEDAVFDGEAIATYPPDSWHGTADSDDDEILRAAIDEFGQTVARKFYDHEKSLRGPGRR